MMWPWTWALAHIPGVQCEQEVGYLRTNVFSVNVLIFVGISVLLENIEHFSTWQEK